MYLHVGNNKNIREKDIIGIFDMDMCTVSSITKKFLTDAQRNDLVVSAKDEIPKNKNHIDHIFYTPQNSIILSWELIINDYNGIYGSDHLPLCVEWKFSN